MIMIRSFLNRSDNNLMVRDYSEIISSGTLNIVTDYNPVGYYVSGDSTAGFQIEVLRALEKAWGVTINIYLENSLEDNLDGLQNQKYDIVARNIPVNSELRELYSFTDPITYNKLVLVQRKAEFNDSIKPIRGHLNLAKKTIHVAAESPAILRLNNLSEEIGDTIFVIEDPVYETEQLVILVASGEIDFTISNEIMANRLTTILPEIDIETDISFTQIESWALRNESPVLLDSLNSWLKQFKATDDYNVIYQKYYIK